MNVLGIDFWDARIDAVYISVETRLVQVKQTNLIVAHSQLSLYKHTIDFRVCVLDTRGQR